MQFNFNAILIMLSLKRLRGGVKLSRFFGFSRSISSRKRIKPCFFNVTFLILSSVTTFMKLSLNFLMSFKRYEDFLPYCELLWSILWIFRYFLVTKKLMTWACKRWCRDFFILNQLLKYKGGAKWQIGRRPCLL